MPVRRLLIFSLLIGSLLVGACGAAAPRDLSELVVEDSLYVDPNSERPYSGPVFRAFADDPPRIQLEGELLNGTWEGELIVFHPNGRVRYMGSFASGERCGPWTENADSVAPANLYEDFVREVESMGLYPPCDPSD